LPTKKNNDSEAVVCFSYLETEATKGNEEVEIQKMIMSATRLTFPITCHKITTNT
jgi:hypothetical protein